MCPTAARPQQAGQPYGDELKEVRFHPDGVDASCRWVDIASVEIFDICGGHHCCPSGERIFNVWERIKSILVVSGVKTSCLKWNQLYLEGSMQMACTLHMPT